VEQNGTHQVSVYRYERRDAMIHVPSFIKIGSSIHKLMGGGIYRHTDEQTHRHKNDMKIT
jgi:hypothetical protein